jgi:hypothetical protein
LIWIVTVLRWLGFRFATVSEALAAPYGRFACLTFDSIGPASAEPTSPEAQGGHGLAVDGDAALYRKLSPMLKRLKVPATTFVATRPITKRDPGTQVQFWSQLRDLQANGWEIGSQGHDVTDLTEKGYGEQRRQIARSTALMRERLGSAPRLFAYPYGAYDATTVSVVRDEGYAGAVTLRRGLNGDGAEPFQLRRLPLGFGLVRDLAAIFRVALFESPVSEPAQPARASEEALLAAMPRL